MPQKLGYKGQQGNIASEYARKPLNKSAEEQTQTSSGPIFANRSHSSENKYAALLKKYKYFAIGAAALIIGGAGYFIYPKGEKKVEETQKPAPIVQTQKPSLEAKVNESVKIPVIQEYKEPVQKAEKKVQTKQEEENLSNITPYQEEKISFPKDFFFRGYMLSKAGNYAVIEFGGMQQIIKQGSTINDYSGQFILSRVTNSYAYLKNELDKEQAYTMSSRVKHF